jgi:hypothetical protein
MTEESPPKLDDATEFRRSPRLKSDSVDANNGNVGSSGKLGRRTGRLSYSELRLLSEGMNRRRSPRFSVASESQGRDSSSRAVKVCVTRNSLFFVYFIFLFFEFKNYALKISSYSINSDFTVKCFYKFFFFFLNVMKV